MINHSHLTTSTWPYAPPPTVALGTPSDPISVDNITAISQNAISTSSQSLKHALSDLRRNEKTRLRNADEVHLTLTPELWHPESMPSVEDLIDLIFNFLSDVQLEKLRVFFPITAQTSHEKISTLYGFLAQIPVSVQNQEFKVSHKHIFYLFQFYHKIKPFFIKNTYLTEISNLFLEKIKNAINSIISELCTTETIGDKIKISGLKEMTLLVRYANLIHWPTEEDSNLLRLMIQQHVFATEVKGSNPDFEETWSSVSYILDYIIAKCEYLNPNQAYFQGLKNALERPIRSVFDKTGKTPISDSIILHCLSQVKASCIDWKTKLDAGQEIQLPMLYHGSKEKEGPVKQTFPLAILNSNIRNLDESKATLEGAFLSTWPEIGYGPPAASFSILQLFRAHSDLINFFDPQKRNNNLSTIEETRWISFRELVPVSLYDLQCRTQKTTILTLGVAHSNCEAQKREAPHLNVMDFDTMRCLAYILRDFPLLFPKYISGRERIVKRQLSGGVVAPTSGALQGSRLSYPQPLKRAKK